MFLYTHPHHAEGKNVEVLLPHAHRGRVGSKIYFHMRVELIYYDQTAGLFLSKKAQIRVEAKRSGYFSVLHNGAIDIAATICL